MREKELKLEEVEASRFEPGHAQHPYAPKL
jgi:hypothetical protein